MRHLLIRFNQAKSLLVSRTASANLAGPAVVHQRARGLPRHECVRGPQRRDHRTVEWAPDPALARTRESAAVATAAAAVAEPGQRVSVFTALQEQLGLKLESTKGPVEVLVIDSISRPMPD